MIIHFIYRRISNTQGHRTQSDICWARWSKMRWSWTEGRVKWMEDDDLSVPGGVATWWKSERLWTWAALNDNKRILELFAGLAGSRWSCCRIRVTRRMEERGGGGGFWKWCWIENGGIPTWGLCTGEAAGGTGAMNAPLITLKQTAKNQGTVFFC